MPTAMTKPMMWAIGRLITASSSRKPTGASPATFMASRPLWRSSAPFGLPVVPDV